MERCRYSFSLSAEFWQFYIQDEWSSDEYVEWTSEEDYDPIALAPGTVSICTNCDRIVPVEIVICRSEPLPDFEDWDHLVECGIDVPSGRLIVAGCFDDCEGEAPRINLRPGSYRARVCYGNQYSCQEYVGCSDYYRIMLWPSKDMSFRPLKRRVDVLSSWVT